MTQVTIANIHTVDIEQTDLHQLLLLGQKVKEDSLTDSFFVCVPSPSEAAMQAIRNAFGLHPLTVEDCLNSSETREKNETFDKYLFIVSGSWYY